MAENNDPLDIAADLSRSLAEAQIGAVRQLAKPEQLQNPDGTWPVTECIDCGAELGKRAELGRVRCVHCQGLLERRGAPWRR